MQRFYCKTQRQRSHPRGLSRYGGSGLCYVLAACALLLALGACSDFTQSVDPVIDQVPDERLNNEAQVNFLITGVKVRFATTHDNLMVAASGLSDEFIFDSRVPNATFPQFQEIDLGDITLDNNSVDAAFFPLGELRYFADDLIRRANAITVSNANLKQRAIFTGYLYGGIARYLYAAYIGLNPTEGGGVIDNGPFIPSAQMYDLALESFQQALNHAADDYDRRVVNSLRARIYLIRGDYANARTFALQGLAAGDAPLQSLHSTESTNYYWQQAGLGRPQFVCNDRFLAYVTADPAEAARISLAPITGRGGAVFQRQAKYATDSSPIDFISWQENELMLAELDLRLGDAIAALSKVNALRASHKIGALAAIDLNGLLVERDKELFVTGIRLVDQRRFGRFHLPAGRWQFLPITDDKRNNNPNFD